MPDERLRAVIDAIVADAALPTAAERDDLRRELLSHFEEAAAGPGGVDAALTRFGSPRRVARSLGKVHRAPRVARHGQGASMLQDVCFGFRMLRRTPGLSAVALVCLTLGIGANAAVFTWIEGILLRPFPLVVDQDRLYAVAGTDRGGGDTGLSWPDFLDLQRDFTLADAFIGEKITGTSLTVGDRAERAPGSMVSAGYFDAVGVRPILGRGFLPGEDAGRNAHPIAVISHQMWQDRFHGDPAVVGRTQLLAGLPHTIVGVAPKGFHGTFVGYAFQFWVPVSMQAQFDAGVYKLEDRGARWVEPFVRLKPGVSLARAQAEVSAIAARLEREYPSTNRGRGIRLFPLWATPFNGASMMLPTLTAALVVVVVVLLIACANVGNLLLVRALARQREMTIRLSIGATRWRLVRQLLTEGLVLSAIAATGAVAVANWLRDALALLTPPRGGIVLHFPGAIDWRVLVASGVVCLLATLLFALVPAVTASGVDLAGALRSDGGGVLGGRGKARVRATLVVLQISLSFVLIVAVGLLLKSARAMHLANPGFATDGLLTTSVDLFTAGYGEPRARISQEAILERVQAIAGVESAAWSRMTPFSYREYASAPLAIEGYVPPPDQQPSAPYNAVGPGYFQTMGIPVMSGREFQRNDDETAARVAIVDETMAARFWRGGDPVGRLMQVGARPVRIVGVVRAARYRNLLEAPEPFFYLPLRQTFSAVAALHVRTPQSPAAFAPALAAAIHAVDGNVSPGEVITMREQVDRTGAAHRVAVAILAVFGAIALLMAAVGLYGVTAATVAQGARELAVRLALGAEPAGLLRAVIAHGLSLAVGGVAIGCAIALALTRLLGHLLYDVSPRDPAAFLGAGLALSVTAVAACLVPALKTTRIDPIRSLRG
jgi:macrolide transport system ATP-binding/permease protein